jgi:2-amino-4-hydroxy-6-hydroxymethyldihydropteridine diphosphokinase
LFDFLKWIELELGRQNSIKWGPREIDLDILFYNNLIYTDEYITIPHKGILEREFVLIPLSEIEPELVHPAAGEKISMIELPEAGKTIINKFELDVLIK